MIDVPGLTPVTTPEADPTVAIVVVPLVHVPPLVALLKVVVLPTHIVMTPVIGVGDGNIFTVNVTQQPAESV